MACAVHGYLSRRSVWRDGSNVPRLLFILAAVVAVAVFVWRPPAPRAPAVISSDGPPAAVKHTHHSGRSPAGDAVVYVAGAVVHPGLYHLHSGARADDAVRSAGGFRSGADTGAINLAAHVADGDEVYVAALGEPTPHFARTRRSHQSSKKNPTALLDVNTASADELATIPGIGATLAARVVDVRERDGAYTTFDQLLDVAGMTASRLARAELYLRI